LNGSLPEFKLATNGENLNPQIFGQALNRNTVLNHQNHFEGLGLTISRAVSNKHLSVTSTSSLLQTVPINNDLSQLVFRLTGSSTIPQTILIRPDNARFTPSDASKRNSYGVGYLESPSEHKAFWIINNPAKGDWHIEITDNSNPVLDVIGFRSPIGINIIEPSSDGSSGRIEWIDSGSTDSARISLYYDRDNTGLDGVLIVKDIRPVNGKNSYAWSYVGVPPGSYYIYAIIEDGCNAPRSSYSKGKIIVPSNVLPPANFQAAAVDTSIILTWNQPALQKGTIQGYSVKYWDKDAPNNQLSFSVKDTNQVSLVGIVPGRNYQFEMASISKTGDLSIGVQSNVVSFVSATVNNPPAFRFNPDKAMKAKVWSPYFIKVNAFDADGDILIYTLLSSPAGMSINSGTGEINWMPNINQIGNHEVKVRVADGKGGVDSLRYIVKVEENNRSVVTFSRNSYDFLHSIAIFTVIDIEANKSTLISDEITLTLKSKNALRNVICTESNANSGIFNGSFDLNELSLTPGDTVWAIYTSNLSEQISTFAYWQKALAAPALLSPANGATDVPTNPMFSWNVSAEATSYRLQISTSSSFSTTVFDQSGITGTSQLVTGLSNNTSYYWRVNATNSGGTSEWSSVWNFTTIRTTSVEQVGSDVPKTYALYFNYPNPFNPITTISFDLPVKSYVSLIIFDALGREVVKLINEELLAGKYSKQWDASGLTSGVYFYRIQAGSFSETKKLILLK
jgi:hypothetical protein